MSALFLLTHLVDFDQTCIETLLGQGRKYLDFGDLDFILEATPAF